MRSDTHKEFWVGCLVLFVLVLLISFGWLMGVVGPFEKRVQFSLLYGFAGGVEVGSPVRVSGVKVGKVERIQFLSQEEREKNPGATLKITIGVTAQAAEIIHENSHFFINMAGIIGERYVEVTSGDQSLPLLAANSLIRGTDPPRIDQLLSQGYGVFGKIQEFMEKNQKTVAEFLENTSLLIQDANKFLKGKDKQKILELITRMNDLASDMQYFTGKMREAKAQQAIDELLEMIHRGSEIDKPTLKKFLQEEGIRARIF